MKPLSPDYLTFLGTSPTDQQLSEHWYREHHKIPVARNKPANPGQLQQLINLAQELRIAAKVITGDQNE
jgi:hypothetical protein